MNPWLGDKRGYLSDFITQVWVCITGKKINPADYKWLMGPAGNTKKIGSEFYSDKNYAAFNSAKKGLLEDLDVLRNGSTFSFHPKVKDFYENTSQYSFEVWSEWKGMFKPFGKLLALIFSRRLQQLNVPLNPMDTSKGISSEVVNLKDNNTGDKINVWLRRNKKTGDIIYSGVYSSCTLPEEKINCIKVVFPLPNGNAAVIMRPEVLEDGSLRLTSAGKGIGSPGFYFVVMKNETTAYVRYLKTMREVIHVYEDEEKVLRTDHLLTIWRMPFLKLHYRINLS